MNLNVKMPKPTDPSNIDKIITLPNGFWLLYRENYALGCRTKWGIEGCDATWVVRKPSDFFVCVRWSRRMASTGASVRRAW